MKKGTETDRMAIHTRSILTEAATQVYTVTFPHGFELKIDTWYAPRGKAQRAVWKNKFESVRMQRNKDPHEYECRVDEAVDMLACLEDCRDEEETIDATTRGLTKDYKTESRALLLQPGICRAGVESILRE